MEDKIKSMIDMFEVKVGFNNIPATFVSTTNERFKKYEGYTVTLSLRSMMAFIDLNSFHTSYIVQVYLERNELDRKSVV